MHKTVSASIGPVLFVLEESAFARLDAYLKAVRAHFAATDDADEIVSDIEDRIAEELSAKLTARKKVIHEKDVDELIRTMGTVEDFRKFGSGEPLSSVANEHATPRNVRLYRDADDQVIAGVAAGIAKYFNIDPAIIRLAFGLSLLLGGFGFILYILLWIVLPEAKTTAQKVEMTGGRVTLASIQKRIEAAAPTEKTKGFLHKALTLPFALVGSVLRAIAKVLRVLVPLIGRVIGVAITIGTAFAIAGATFVMLVLLINPNSPYIGFPIREAMGAIAYVTLLTSAYALVVLPLVIVLIVAASLVTLRNQVRLPAMIALGSTWFLFLVVGGATMFSIAPQVEYAAKQYEAEHHQIETKTVDLKNFDTVRIEGALQANVTQGSAYSVRLEGTASDLENATIALDKNFLVVGNDGPMHDSCMFFCARREMTLTVTMPSLKSAVASGASRMTIAGFTEPALSLSADGASRITAESDAVTVDTHAVGASRIELRGSGTTLSTVLSGAARLRAGEFTVKTATIEAAGASQATLSVIDKLSGTLSGASHVDFTQHPTMVDVKTSGASHVEDMGDDDDQYREEFRDWD